MFALRSTRCLLLICSHLYTASLPLAHIQSFLLELVWKSTSFSYSLICNSSLLSAKYSHIDCIQFSINYQIVVLFKFNHHVQWTSALPCLWPMLMLNTSDQNGRKILATGQNNIRKNWKPPILHRKLQWDTTWFVPYQTKVNVSCSLPNDSYYSAMYQR